MRRAIITEMERIKKQIPSKNDHRFALFIIIKVEDGYEVEETVSNDFAHLGEAATGDQKYLVEQIIKEFDTIKAAVSWLDERGKEYHAVRPCVAVLGTFDREGMNEIRKVKWKPTLLNDKYLFFLYGLKVNDDLKTNII